MRISYVTASRIGEPSGFSGETDWERLHDRMAQETTPETFRRVARAVKALGFEGIEIYTGHCDYSLRAPDYSRSIRQVCDVEGLEIVAYAGGMGLPDGSREALQRTFDACEALGAPVMAGGLAPGADWDEVAELLRERGLVFAYENHPESSADEVLEKISGREDVIKACLDTGNLTAAGGDAREAAEALLGHLAHVHLKDVPGPGRHDCRALGEGAAKVEETVRFLAESGYEGWASIEHETFDRDPDGEIELSLGRVREWLGA